MLDEIARKLLLASLGAVELTRDKMESIVGELIKKGKISREEGTGLIEEILRKGGESKKNLEDKIEAKIVKMMAKLNIPTKKEIQELKEKIKTLTEKIEEIAKSKK